MTKKENEAVIYKVICEGQMKCQKSKEMQIAFRDKSPLIWALIIGINWSKT